MSLFSFVPGPYPQLFLTHFPKLLSSLSLPQQLLSGAIYLREPNEAPELDTRQVSVPNTFLDKWMLETV